MAQDKDDDEEFSFDDDSFNFDDDDGYEEETSVEEELNGQEEEKIEVPAEEESSLESTETTPTSLPETTVTKAPPLEKLSPDQIPLSVSIELGRVQIPLSTLINLQKGNLLELGIQPEAGVDIVVQGKCIGKGELLKIGDTLGIRILDV